MGGSYPESVVECPPIAYAGPTGKQEAVIIGRTATGVVGLPLFRWGATEGERERGGVLKDPGLGGPSADS